jgi:5-methylcytosine-specific restriction endonuclease McrA
MKKCVICDNTLGLQRKLYCSHACKSIGYKARNIRPPSRKGYKYTEQEKERHCEIMGRLVSSMSRPEIIAKSQLTKKKTFDLRGRKSKVREVIKHTDEYKSWRTSVFTRDNFTCILCSKKGYVEADHIKPFSEIIKENNIRDVISARECIALWDISNGRTLCKKCHLNTETYGNKRKFDV